MTNDKEAHTNDRGTSAVTAAKPAIAFDIDDLVLPDAGCCFHCGDPVPTPPFSADILGEARQMCCMGCQLAAESIVEAGLEQYYLDRSEINRTAALPTELERLQAYDHDDIKSQFVYAQDGSSVAELSVNNLRCAACTWLIESRLYELEGVKQCQVNLTNQRMRIIWDETKLPISEILLAINKIGYEAKPYRQDTHEAMLARYNKTMMIRLGIAALGAMQAMMFAVGIYFGNYSGMLVEQRDFLRWVSLFVSIPVFFYSAVPFFTSAWSALKARQVNMDVPVSIALIVTFFASLYATLTGSGETYFDSVSMFVFFLLAGKYIEHNARLKAANMANDLVVVEPTIVQKITSDSQLADALRSTTTANTVTSISEPKTTSPSNIEINKEHLNRLEQLGDLIRHAKNSGKQADPNLQSNSPDLHRTNQHALEDNKAAPILSTDIDSELSTDINSEKKTALQETQAVTSQSLRIGDVILIDAGSEVVADGILCSKTATVSQSLLTGESDLIVKQRGDEIIGGSQNDSQPFIMLVTALPEDSQIALIDRLMNRALSEKPKIAQQADRWARWFVARILLLSIVVFIAWYLIDPSQAIWATVAVLVATCPCALSLATPIALTVSTNRLASYGFLTTRGHTIQTLADITHVAFDKTGTLTYGKPNLLYIENLTLEKTQPDVPISESSLPEGDVAEYSNDDLLAIAAALEVGSRHPIASALLDAAYQLHLPTVTGLIHHPAGGVEAQVASIGQDDTYRLGHPEFALQATDVNEADLKAKDLKTRDLNAKNSKKTLDHVAPLDINLEAHHASSAVVLSRWVSDKATTLSNEPDLANKDAGGRWHPMALYYFNDSVREGMGEMVAALKDNGVETLILTGDPSDHANKVAAELSVDNIYKGLSPTDKVNHIKQLQQLGHVVMMVGDGINDAPVLAAANVSTAIAGAADLAQVSSDSVILNGAVTSVYDAKRVADKAQTIIKQNIRWAIGYNTVVLLPAAFGYVPPWLAAIGMSLSSLVVVLNAVRLRRV